MKWNQWLLAGVVGGQVIIPRGAAVETNRALNLKGIVQVDSRTFLNGSPARVGSEGFLVRRARPSLEVAPFQDLALVFIPDFGGTRPPTIFDAYLNYRYEPALQLRIGRSKTPVGYEQLVEDRNLLFNERSLVTDLVPNRDVGLQLWGDVAEGVLSYAVGLFDGAGDARISSAGPLAAPTTVAGRLCLQPLRWSGGALWSGLAFGAAVSYGSVSHHADGLPNNQGFTTDGQRLFFVYTKGLEAYGPHARLSPQATYTRGPFGLLAEGALSAQRAALPAATRDLQNTAWQVSAQWVLTGEAASLSGITPRRPFSFHGGAWGAWQFVARYGALAVDPAAFPVFADPTVSARRAAAWSVGLNWWVNQDVRVLTSFSRTGFDTGPRRVAAPPLAARPPESVLLTRVQLAF